MKEIIVNKNKYVPCKKEINGTTKIMFGYTPINNTLGRCVTHTFTNKVSVENIKKLINEYYNQKTNANILSGLTYNGYMVWLSTENQQNYKSAYDLAISSNGANLPFKAKLGTDENYIYYTFNTVDEIKDFYLSVYNHIQGCISKGWELKDNIDWTLFI